MAIIPHKLIIGDSFSVTFPDDRSSADSWALDLLIGDSVTLHGTYDTTTFSWTIGATPLQASYQVGTQTFALRLSKSTTDRITIESGFLEVVGIGSQSHSQKMLISIEAFIERRATQGQIDHLESTIGDKTLRRMSFTDLQALRQKYSYLVKIEQKRFPTQVNFTFGR
jgi:hypothetical protein